METKAWQLGSPDTVIYRFFDALRKRLNQKLVRYLLSRGLTGEGRHVLEAGSGPAFASSILARDPRVALSIAVDLDHEALQEARRRDPALVAVNADLLFLPFRDESIDLTWNSSTLEHIPNPSSALAEMQRVTRQGGTVFVGVPNLYGPLGFQRWIAETAVGVWIGTTFNRRELTAMLARAGLNPLDHIFYFFRFFVGVLAQK
jgi:ubiquinone/menaquinone biosynthesis C-methylase UbiE